MLVVFYVLLLGKQRQKGRELAFMSTYVPDIVLVNLFLMHVVRFLNCLVSIFHRKYFTLIPDYIKLGTITKAEAV